MAYVQPIPSSFGVVTWSVVKGVAFVLLVQLVMLFLFSAIPAHMNDGKLCWLSVAELRQGRLNQICVQGTIEP